MDSLKKIEIVPYVSNWPKAFEKEKEHISKALGANFIAIHHNSMGCMMIHFSCI